MAKIIQFDATIKKIKKVSREKNIGCDHKHVIAYTVYRTVRCSICGTELDPFDLLVDMLKAYVPTGPNNFEEKRFNREMEKRNNIESKKEKSSFNSHVSNVDAPEKG